MLAGALKLATNLVWVPPVFGLAVTGVLLVAAIPSATGVARAAANTPNAVLATHFMAPMYPSPTLD